MNDCLKVFTDGNFDNNFIDDIFLLNQKNVPEVGSLKSIAQQRKILSISSYHSILLRDNQLIGFSICFREAQPYWSENFKYFKQKLDRFLYIDRIAIHSEYRRRGYAKRMYEDIFDMATKDDLFVTAEVNTSPKNEDSLKFHDHMGFIEVGQKSFNDHDVSYFQLHPND
tara:strand:+ start:105 stop:611 length:507 start_codon:yes stop_codon:yes gene_type:complete